MVPERRVCRALWDLTGVGAGGRVTERKGNENSISLNRKGIIVVKFNLISNEKLHRQDPGLPLSNMSIQCFTMRIA